MNAANARQVSKRFVIAMNEPAVANHLCEKLLELFPGAKPSIVPSRRELRRLSGMSGGTDWLIVSESIPEQKGGIVREKRTGWEAASEWVNAHGKRGVRRAVVVTDSDAWAMAGIRIGDRLVALPATSLHTDFCELREIIQAGEANVDYVPPTIVHLGISRRGKYFFLGFEDNPEGPLASFFKERVVATSGRTQRFRDFLSTARVRNANALLEKGGFVAALNAFSDEILNTKDSLLRDVLQTANDAMQTLALPKDGQDRNLGRPCPVHLHFHWKCQPSFQPLDLIKTKKAKAHFLNSRFPVVWRIDGSHDSSGATGRHHNPVYYGPCSFDILHSCVEDFVFWNKPRKGLSRLPQHSNEILATLGLVGCKPKDARQREDVHEVFHRDRSDAGATVHITTHGIHRRPVHTSGLVVAPTYALTGDSAQIVRALELADGDPPRIRFGFFNACELGDQLSAAEAAQDVFTCFAEGVIVEGACAEAICNRWPVTVDQALPLALGFYETRPITVHGRAAALFRARLRVFNLFRSATEDSLTDLSWLAPVHVWRQES